MFHLTLLLLICTTLGWASGQQLVPGQFLTSTTNATLTYQTQFAFSSVLIEFTTPTSSPIVYLQASPSVPISQTGNGLVVATSGNSFASTHAHGSPCPSTVPAGMHQFLMYGPGSNLSFTARLDVLNADLSSGAIVSTTSGYVDAILQFTYRHFLFDVPVSQNSVTISIRKLDFVFVVSPTVLINQGGCVTTYQQGNRSTYQFPFSSTFNSVTNIVLNSTSSPPLVPGSRYFVTVINDNGISGGVFNYSMGVCFGSGCSVTTPTATSASPLSSTVAQTSGGLAHPSIESFGLLLTGAFLLFWPSFFLPF